MKKYKKLVSLLCFSLSLIVIILTTTGCSNNQKEDIQSNTTNQTTVETTKNGNTENETNIFPDENIKTTYLIKSNIQNVDKDKFINNDNYKTIVFSNIQDILDNDVERFSHNLKTNINNIPFNPINNNGDVAYRFISYDNEKTHRGISCGVGYDTSNTENLNKEDLISYYYEHCINRDVLTQRGTDYIIKDIEMIFGKIEKPEEFVKSINYCIEAKRNPTEKYEYKTESNASFNISYSAEYDAVVIIAFYMPNLLNENVTNNSSQENVTNYPQEDVQTTYLIAIIDKNLDKNKIFRNKTYTQNFLEDSQKLFSKNAEHFKQDIETKNEYSSIKNTIVDETTYTRILYNDGKCQREINCGALHLTETLTDKSKFAYGYEHVVTKDFLSKNTSDFIIKDIEKIFGEFENEQAFVQEIENAAKTKEIFYFNDIKFRTESGAVFTVAYSIEHNGIMIFGTLEHNLT